MQARSWHEFGSKEVSRKNKDKEISCRDLREFEDLSQAAEKHLRTMGLACSASASDESTSSEESHDNSLPSEWKSQKTWGERNLRSGKMAKIATRVVRWQLWSHSELSMGYVSENISYDELTLKKFVAGYNTILLFYRHLLMNDHIAQNTWVLWCI